MKKQFSKSLTLFIILFTSINLMSCSSDDDDDTTPSSNISQYITGTYTGEVLSVESGKRTITLKVESTGHTSIKCTFIGDNIPSDLTGNFTSDIYAVGNNEIWATAPLVTNVLYYKNEKNITFQKPSIFTFQGTKQ